jgi:hypothetical protein
MVFLFEVVVFKHDAQVYRLESTLYVGTLCASQLLVDLSVLTE